MKLPEAVTPVKASVTAIRKYVCPSLANDQLGKHGTQRRNADDQASDEQAIEQHRFEFHSGSPRAGRLACEIGFA